MLEREGIIPPPVNRGSASAASDQPNVTIAGHEAFRVDSTLYRAGLLRWHRFAERSGRPAQGQDKFGNIAGKPREPKPSDGLSEVADQPRMEAAATGRLLPIAQGSCSSWVPPIRGTRHGRIWPHHCGISTTSQ